VLNDEVSVVFRHTYPERTGDTDHCVLCAGVNWTPCNWRQAHNGRYVDHYTTFAPLVLAHVLEPKQGAPHNGILEQTSGTDSQYRL
jgi:hypothetical protein